MTLEYLELTEDRKREERNKKMTKKVKDETLSVPRKIRGTLEAQGGDKYVFTPYGKGEPTQTNVVTVGKSKMFDTVGRSPQRVAHLVVPVDAPDVRAEMFRQVDALTQGEKTVAEVPVERPAEVVCIHKGKGLQLLVDEKERRLVMHFECPVRRGTNYVAELVSATQRVSQSLMLNSEILRKLERIDN